MLQSQTFDWNHCPLRFTINVRNLLVSNIDFQTSTQNARTREKSAYCLPRPDHGFGTVVNTGSSVFQMTGVGYYELDLVLTLESIIDFGSKTAISACSLYQVKSQKRIL